MKKILRSIYYPLLASCYLLVTKVAFAQTRSGGKIDGELPNPLKVQTIADLIDRVVGYLIIIMAPIATLMILVGAFQILTAGGDPEKFKTGRKTITYAVIGYAIVLLSKGVTLIIKELLGAR